MLFVEKTSLFTSDSFYALMKKFKYDIKVVTDLNDMCDDCKANAVHRRK
jgi:hypothetical protein